METWRVHQEGRLGEEPSKAVCPSVPPSSCETGPLRCLPDGLPLEKEASANTPGRFLQPAPERKILVSIMHLGDT